MGRDRREVVVVESELAVRRLLEGGYRPDSIVVTPSRYERWTAVPPGIPVYQVERSTLDRVTGVSLHRGCLAALPRPQLAGLAELKQVSSCQSVVVTWGIADPVNLGAICRTCRAFGVERMIIGQGADPFDPRAVRASMGNVFCLPLAQLEKGQLAAGLRALGAGQPGQSEQVPLVVLAATPGPEAVDLPELEPRPARWALILGHEGSGLDAEALELADHTVRIPIAPAADSLNVAAAAAVLCYALTAVGVTRASGR